MIPECDRNSYWNEQAAAEKQRGQKRQVRDTEGIHASCILLLITDFHEINKLHFSDCRLDFTVSTSDLTVSLFWHFPTFVSVTESTAAADVPDQSRRRIVAAGDESSDDSSDEYDPFVVTTSYGCTTRRKKNKGLAKLLRSRTHGQYDRECNYFFF